MDATLPPLLALEEASKARDAALLQVKENSGAWFRLCMIELEAILHTFPPEFSGEFIRYKITPLLGMPHSPNIWGSVTREAIKRKLIAETGRLQAMRGAKSHGRRTMTYRMV